MTGPTNGPGSDETPTPDELAAGEPASGEATSDEATSDEAAPAGTRRPPASAAAAAASRARRIGGRSVTARPADAPSPAAPAAKPTAESSSASAVGLTKDSERSEPSTDRAKTRRRRTAEPAVAAPGRSGSDRSGLRWIPAVVLSVAALVLAVVVAVSTHGERWGRPNGGSVRDQVLATAKSCLVSTNTYKYDAIDAYEKKGLACAGGTFATQFRSTVEKVLRKNAPAVKQQQSLQVNTAGLIDVTDDNQWDVLVYGQISVTNTSQTTARLDPFGAVAHLKKINGKWRVTQLCSQSVGGTADACY